MAKAIPIALAGEDRISSSNRSLRHGCLIDRSPKRFVSHCSCAKKDRADKPEPETGLEREYPR